MVQWELDTNSLNKNPKKMIQFDHFFSLRNSICSSPSVCFSPSNVFPCCPWVYAWHPSLLESVEASLSSVSLPGRAPFSRWDQMKKGTKLNWVEGGRKLLCLLSLTMAICFKLRVENKWKTGGIALHYLILTLISNTHGKSCTASAEASTSMNIFLIQSLLIKVSAKI